MSRISLSLLLVLGASAIAGRTGAAEDEDGAPASACILTARSMYNACLLDAGAALDTGIANCRNVPGGSTERKACMQDARMARKEDVQACGGVLEARTNTCELLGEHRYAVDPLLDPDNDFIDPDDVPGAYAPNPYVSVAAGRTLVFRSGEQGEETNIVHVTSDTREILGVPCRVVADVVVEASADDGEVEYEPVEVTDDWFAQDVSGNVYYCGESTREFEDGVLRTIEGSFEAGRDFAKAGRLIRAAPAPAQVDRQEFALGEAEDVVQYLDTAARPTTEEGGENPQFPCDPGCLKTLEFSPLEPDGSEFKYYLGGTGQVLGVGMEDDEFSGERDELLCVGDSLEVLDDPSCAVEDSEALLDALCKVSPDAFCPDE